MKIIKEHIEFNYPDSYLNKNMKITDISKKFISGGITQKIIVLLFVCLSFFAVTVHENKGYAAENSGLSVRLVPENPGAREMINVMLNSFSFNIDAVETSVYLDGKLLKKEIGLKTFDFSSKDLGEESILKITSKKRDGSTATKIISIVPSSVDLVYELNNPHVPFGYLGKSTAISNSALTIYAFPNLVNTNGQRLSKDSLVYT